MSRFSFKSIFLSLLLMFALPVSMITGSIYNQDISTQNVDSFTSIDVNQTTTNRSNTSTLDTTSTTITNDHDTSHEGWTRLDASVYSYPEGYTEAVIGDGKYYLDADTYIIETKPSDSSEEYTYLDELSYIVIEDGADVTLCLNGKSLYQLNKDVPCAISIGGAGASKDTSFTLCDCSEGQVGKIEVDYTDRTEKFLNSYKDDSFSGVSAILIYNKHTSNNDSTLNVTINGGQIITKDNHECVDYDCQKTELTYGIYVYNLDAANTLNLTINDGTFNQYKPIYTDYSPLESSNIWIEDRSYGAVDCYNEINLTINDGTFIATSNDTPRVIYYGDYIGDDDGLKEERTEIIEVNGGTFILSKGYGEETSAFDLSNVSSFTINGGYHDYASVYLENTYDVAINAGYFTDDAYNAISQYIAEKTEVIKKDTSYISITNDYEYYLENISSNADLLYDPDYDEDYPNTIYFKIGLSDIFVPEQICVGTDITNYITIDNNSDVYLSSVDVKINGQVIGSTTPTETGTYVLLITYAQHVTTDGRIPKAYNGGGESYNDDYITECEPLTFEVVNHIASTEYSSNDNYHYKTCTNTYCDAENVELDTAEHTKTFVVTTSPTETSGGVLTVSCKDCDWSTTITLNAINDIDESDIKYTSETEEATCQKDGYIKYFYNYDEDNKIEIYSETLNQISHSYTGEYGYIDESGHYQYCIYCNEATGNTSQHTEGVEITKEPTLDDEGVLTAYCLDCKWSNTFTVSAIKDIDEEDSTYTTTITKYPSCTEDGTKQYYYIYKKIPYPIFTETIKSSGHIYSGDYYNNTDGEVGHYQLCERCSTEESTIYSHEVSVEDNSLLYDKSTGGSFTLKCSYGCGWSNTVTLLATNEIYDDTSNYEIKTEQEQSCTQEGIIKYYYVYGDSEDDKYLFYTETVSALEHNYEGTYNCDDNSSEHYQYCTICETEKGNYQSHTKVIEEGSFSYDATTGVTYTLTCSDNCGWSETITASNIKDTDCEITPNNDETYSFTNEALTAGDYFQVVNEPTACNEYQTIDVYYVYEDGKAVLLGSITNQEVTGDHSYELGRYGTDGTNHYQICDYDDHTLPCEGENWSNWSLNEDQETESKTCYTCGYVETRTKESSSEEEGGELGEVSGETGSSGDTSTPSTDDTSNNESDESQGSESEGEGSTGQTDDSNGSSESSGSEDSDSSTTNTDGSTDQTDGNPSSDTTDQSDDTIDEQQESNKGFAWWWILLIILGCLLVLALIIVLILIFKKDKNDGDSIDGESDVQEAEVKFKASGNTQTTEVKVPVEEQKTVEEVVKPQDNGDLYLSKDEVKQILNKLSNKDGSTNASLNYILNGLTLDQYLNRYVIGDLQRLYSIISYDDVKRIINDEIKKAANDKYGSLNSNNQSANNTSTIITYKQDGSTNNKQKKPKLSQSEVRDIIRSELMSAFVELNTKINDSTTQDIKNKK